MFILKKLIIKEWYKFFFSSLIILFLLLTTANLISGFLRGNVTPIEVMQNYFIEIPSFLNKIFPLSCLIGSLFTINKLINRNELTAIFAGGYSRKQFIFDLIQASLLVSLFHLFTAGFIKPYIKSKRVEIIGKNAFKFRNLGKKGLSASTIGAGKIWYKSNGYYFSFVAFDKKNNILKDISLYSYDNSYHLDSIISAQSAIYRENKIWELENVKTINKLNNSQFPAHIQMESFDLPMNETPEDIRKIEADITTLNVKGLYNYIQTLKESGINTFEYEVIFFEIFSGSLICILFSLIGSLSIFTPNRRAMSLGKNIFFIFIFSIFYWLINSYSLELGRSSKINPYIATFSVPLIYILFLSIIFFKNRKLS